MQLSGEPPGEMEAGGTLDWEHDLVLAARQLSVWRRLSRPVCLVGVNAGQMTPVAL
jgi:hypothetical protein